MTDDQLLAQQLRISDPYAVNNLCRDKPDPALDPQIVGEYDVTPPGGRAANPDGPWIWCCHCQSETHWHGFVITNNTGKRYLIGSACGPKYYHVSFTGAHNQFRDRAQRQSVVNRLRRIAALRATLDEACSEILHSDSLREVDVKREELRKACPNAFVRLASFVQSGTGLSAVERYRDFAAEAERDRRTDSEERLPPIYREGELQLGQVDGAALFRTTLDCRRRLIDLQSAIKEADKIVSHGTDDVSTRLLLKAVKVAEDAHAAANAAIEECNRAGRLFDGNNISRLSRWSVQFTDFSFDSDGLRLRIESRREGVSIVEPLPEIYIPALPELGP